MLTEAVELREFHKHGFACHGIIAKVDIPANTLICYCMVFHKEGDFRTSGKGNPLKVKNPPLTHTKTVAGDPTAWFVTNDKIFTRRDVKKDEQLCYDYALTDPEASLHYGMICKCGTNKCRGRLTFSEWRSRAFVLENKGHLTSFIMRKHLENGRYDPRVELLSKSDGQAGLFCRQNSEYNLKAGETVLIFSGKIIHRNEMTKGALTQRELNMSFQIGKELWRVPSLSNNGQPIWETSDHVNHSYDPNCGMKDSVTVVAIKDILPGEEITIDYAMMKDGSSNNPSDNFDCLCGSSNCRRRFTTSDWKNPELQAK